ncbi:MAG: hypothetical protein RIA69_03130 [Cyclobacteriaceae bacterium]
MKLLIFKKALNEDFEQMKDAEDNSEDSLKFENEFRKLKLSAETGAEFYGESDNLTPSGESQFIDYIEAFNKAEEANEWKKVKGILSNPAFPSPSDLKPDELAEQLERAFDLLKENNISLDVLYDVSKPEIYRFIVEDLLEEEISIIDLPGMITCFTYEDFYPNDEEDLRRYTQEFMDMLIKAEFEFMDHALHKSLSFRNQQLSEKAFISQMMELVVDVNLLGSDYQTAEIAISPDQASVEVSVSTKSDTTLVTVYFVHDNGYWYISGLDWPSS